MDLLVSSIISTWEEVTLAAIPLEIKSRISEDSLSSMLHTHTVGMISRSDTSGDFKERIPDIHLMQMVHQSYVVGCNLSFYVCPA